MDKYNLRPFIKLEHRLTIAIYAEDTGKWNLTIQHPSENGVVERFDDDVEEGPVAPEKLEHEDGVIAAMAEPPASKDLAPLHVQTFQILGR